MHAVRTGLVALAAGALAIVGVGVGAANAEAPHHYTHETTAKKACTIRGNYPQQGKHTSYTWRVGKGAKLGVRYTVGDYALIKDLARSGANVPIHYGFIPKSCLTDHYAYAYDFTHRLPNLYGVGSNHQAEPVVFAPTPGSRRGTVTVGSQGSVRNKPHAFVIGNVTPGEKFVITSSTCGKHSSGAWIYGYDSAVGRWGYLEASHLPACT